jgi:hypothetical protein
MKQVANHQTKKQTLKKKFNQSKHATRRLKAKPSTLAKHATTQTASHFNIQPMKQAISQIFKRKRIEISWINKTRHQKHPGMKTSNLTAN